MIITKTPLRISFFGGGTDIPEFFNQHGGAVLSTTFDKYSYVNVRHLPRFFEYRNQATYSRIERVNSPEEFQHPVVREGMKMLDMHELIITHSCDLPSRTGLGSSSSFAVGLLNSFYALKGKYAGKHRLASDAIHLERVLCQEAGGMQDQVAAAYGGLNRIEFCENEFRVSPVLIQPERKRLLNENLMLFFTGFARYSAEVQKNLVAAIPDKTGQLLEMKALVYEAESILTNRHSDLDEFGRLLDHTWRLKRQMHNNVSQSSIDAAYERAMKAGALGGKLLGAGGGGFLLFYVRKEDQPRVKKALHELMNVPFQFENSGSEILYYDPEDYTFPDGEEEA